MQVVFEHEPPSSIQGLALQKAAQTRENEPAASLLERGSVLTIGAYDGVHIGHQTIIAEVRQAALERDAASVVVTFDQHPGQVIRPQSAPRLLTSLDQKLELLEATGVDVVYVVHFDLDRAKETAEEFIHEVLYEALQAKLIIVGENFHFGYQRQGNVDMLRDVGPQYGFEVMGYRLVDTEGQAARDDQQVSSTAIRRALADGRLDTANKMLGRSFEMIGPVVPGDRRGGPELGFPTANVAIAEIMLMPCDGIYAGWMQVLDANGAVTETIPSAIYVGKRPTYYDDTAMTLLEVHGLNYTGDLYGKNVRVQFTHHIRGDKAFTSSDELRGQLHLDCREAAALLNVK